MGSGVCISALLEGFSTEQESVHRSKDAHKEPTFEASRIETGILNPEPRSPKDPES